MAKTAQEQYEAALEKALAADKAVADAADTGDRDKIPALKEKARKLAQAADEWRVKAEKERPAPAEGGIVYDDTVNGSMGMEG